MARTRQTAFSNASFHGDVDRTGTDLDHGRLADSDISQAFSPSDNNFDSPSSLAITNQLPSEASSDIYQKGFIESQRTELPVQDSHLNIGSERNVGTSRYKPELDPAQPYSTNVEFISSLSGCRSSEILPPHPKPVTPPPFGFNYLIQGREHPHIRFKKQTIKKQTRPSSTEFLHNLFTGRQAHFSPAPQSAPANVDFLPKERNEPHEGQRSSIESSIPYKQSARRSFKYSPLPASTSGSLRLIGFDNSPSDILLCSMICTDPWIQDIEYHCLSYCWGEAGKTRPIYIKMSEALESPYKPFYVTGNLYRALKSLSSTHSNQKLWIDAISINQHDLLERSAQVAMMREIYSKAEGVLVWLGEDYMVSQAYYIIAELSQRFTIDTGRQAYSIIEADGLALGQDHLELLQRYTSQDIGGNAPMEAYELLAKFFSLPWFRRTWVLQEALSHTKVTVRLGTMSLSWGAIILSALWQSFLTRDYTARSIQDINTNDMQGTGYLPELWLGLLHNQTPRGLSMVELVCRARDFQASDPRDKVFGLLGLANDLDTKKLSPNLRPDYTKSREEVYSGFARDIILKTGELDILSAVNTFTAEGRHGKSISWMPDLDFSIATIRGLGFPKKYNTSFSTKVDCTTMVGNFYTPSVLNLSGFIVDAISLNISSLLTLSKDLYLHIGNRPHAISALWNDFLQSTNRYKDGLRKTLQAFIHTITATGFALPTAHPLGHVVPPHDIPSLIDDFAAYCFAKEPNFRQIVSSLVLSEDGDADQFAVLAGKACHERCFFISKEGRMGLCPRDARKGDLVVVLYGGSVPYVLREMEDGRFYFVGECYVDGLMFGEAEALKREKGLEDRVFDIR